jgi:hypothetical protein
LNIFYSHLNINKKWAFGHNHRTASICYLTTANYFVLRGHFYFQKWPKAHFFWPKVATASLKNVHGQISKNKSGHKNGQNYIKIAQNHLFTRQL